ncbi:MAG: type II toxin-antitoxin system HicB family antitoxin [Clostridium sp.]|nr:type II toxin-antitoxin system HicB family antitoxin [Clostridium sp.]
METIKVEVSWSGKNYGGGWGYPEVGAIISTGKTLEEFKDEFVSALEFHVKGMLSDGDTVPQWLADKDYKIEYDLKASALLRQAERFTTMAALSRVTGINQRLLSNYASEVKRPRPAQLKRIVDGIHQIGQSCLALC